MEQENQHPFFYIKKNGKSEGVKSIGFRYLHNLNKFREDGII